MHEVTEACPSTFPHLILPRVRKSSWFQPKFSLKPYVTYVSNSKALDVVFLNFLILTWSGDYQIVQRQLFSPHFAYPALHGLQNWGKKIGIHDFQYFPISCKNGFDIFGNRHHEDYYFQNFWLEGWDITARPGWTFSTKLGEKNSALPRFSILPDKLQKWVWPVWKPDIMRIIGIFKIYGWKDEMDGI